MIKPPNTYQPRKVLVNAILLSLFALSSCAIIENAMPKYYEFEVKNESSEDIVIKSFEKNRVIDSIPIKSKESYSKVVEERQFMDNPTIFGSMLVDSVVIINQQEKSTILTCQGEPLIASLVTCPELGNSLVNLAFIKGEEIHKRVDGKFITYRHSISYTDSDFQ